MQTALNSTCWSCIALHSPLRDAAAPAAIQQCTPTQQFEPPSSQLCFCLLLVTLCQALRHQASLCLSAFELGASEASVRQRCPPAGTCIWYSSLSEQHSNSSGPRWVIDHMCASADLGHLWADVVKKRSPQLQDKLWIPAQYFGVF